MQEEKQKRLCLSYNSWMKKLLFWVAYLIGIVVIYLALYTTPAEKPDVGIKQSTLALIKHFEGVRHTAYEDSQGNQTIGVGHHIKPHEHTLHFATLSNKQVHKLLEADMKPCEGFLKNRVGQPLNQPQFDALMSLCFNIGVDQFARSEVVRQLNKQNPQKAANAILNWDRPAELKKRREKERKLFLQGA